MILRTGGSRVAQLFMYLLTLVALVPLALVLYYVVVNGWPAASQPDFYIHFERPVGIPGGGVNHAIVGTLMLIGVASLLAIPVGVLGGVHLAEYHQNQWAHWVRLASDVLVGAPSIAIGLVIFGALVAPFKHFSSLSGSVALSILMLPVIVRTTEGALLLVPSGIREAGLALGLPRWRVALQLVLRAGLPGVVTGCLLAVARAAGETAPLLFTAFGNSYFSTNFNGPVSALPLIVYHDALSPFKDRIQTAWGAALVLIVVVLIINVGSRFVLRRQIALARRLQ